MGPRPGPFDLRDRRGRAAVKRPFQLRAGRLTYDGALHGGTIGSQIRTITTRRAMMASVTDIGTLIVHSPDIRGGRARIAGTGVTVHRIVAWYKLGLSPEEIAARVGHLSLAQIHAALSYYHANQESVENALAADYDEAERLERENRDDSRSAG